MTRFGKILGAAFFTALFSASASAASQATIKSASEGVQLGKEGDWKSAKAGMAIADTDFVKIPDGAAATITLPDKTTRDFLGRAIIPGRRLTSEKTSAGAMIWFSQGVQKAATAIVGKEGDGSAGNAAGKAGTPTPHPPVWAGEGPTEHHGSPIELPDLEYSKGHYAAAIAIANAVLADPKATAYDRRLAQEVRGTIAAANAEYAAALKDLDAAAGPVMVEESTGSASVRVAALLQRGQVNTQLGNDAKAAEDFKAAADAAPDKSPQRYQAKFLLGVLAASQNDLKTARNWFEQIHVKGYEEMYGAGMAMVETPK